MKLTLLIFTFVFFSQLLNAQTTAIPDPNFEQALINLGYDSGVPNGIVPTSIISGVTSLNISNENISDLTGIEEFTSLITLLCNGNQLTSLNVSQNLALKVLYCFGNQLTSLDLSQNSMLEKLFCFENQITSIDVSQNPTLEFLSLNNNQLTSIDISQNSALEYLRCGLNQIASLDVSQNLVLESLECYSNELTSLDISQNALLTYLDCKTNQLTSLDISQNVVLEYLNCNSNELTCLNMKNGNNGILAFTAFYNPNLACITVDDAVWSTSTWFYRIDTTSSFSNNCADPCSVLSINNFSSLVKKLNVYPNPTKGKITIDLNEFTTNTKATLFNSLGQVVFSESFNNSSQISFEINSQKGLYFLQLNSNSQKSQMIKIIME
jgi:hypothetical protein